MKKNTIPARLCCILLCLAVALSLTFVLAAEGHHCEDADCLVCLELHVCKSLLRSLAGAALSTAVFWCIRRAAPVHRKPVYVRSPANPVLLRVKLTN